jgi:hypothetical protein
MTEHFTPPQPSMKRSEEDTMMENTNKPLQHARNENDRLVTLLQRSVTLNQQFSDAIKDGDERRQRLLRLQAVALRDDAKRVLEDEP